MPLPGFANEKKLALSVCLIFQGMRETGGLGVFRARLLKSLLERGQGFGPLPFKVCVLRFQHLVTPRSLTSADKLADLTRSYPFPFSLPHLTVHFWSPSRMVSWCGTVPAWGA